MTNMKYDSEAWVRLVLKERIARIWSHGFYEYHSKSLSVSLSSNCIFLLLLIKLMFLLSFLFIVVTCLLLLMICRTSEQGPSGMCNAFSNLFSRHLKQLELDKRIFLNLTLWKSNICQIIYLLLHLDRFTLYFVCLRCILFWKGLARACNG